MKQRSVLTQLMFIVLLSFCLTSCAAIGGIFKAGAWAGGLVVAIVVVVIIFIIVRLGRRS